MARRKTNKNPDNQEVQTNVQEMLMLFNSDFSDEQLEHYLNKGMIKVSEKSREATTDSLGWRLHHCHLW
jgi:hypothetical protein